MILIDALKPIASTQHTLESILGLFPSTQRDQIQQAFNYVDQQFDQNCMVKLASTTGYCGYLGLFLYAALAVRFHEYSEDDRMALLARSILDLSDHMVKDRFGWVLDELTGNLNDLHPDILMSFITLLVEEGIKRNRIKNLFPPKDAFGGSDYYEHLMRVLGNKDDYVELMKNAFGKKSLETLVVALGLRSLAIHIGVKARRNLLAYEMGV